MTLKRVESSVLIAKMTLEDLDLSVRTYNCLKRAGFTTVADLTAKTEDELMLVRNLGRKSVEEVKRILDYLGVELRFNGMRFEDVYVNHNAEDIRL